MNTYRLHNKAAQPIESASVLFVRDWSSLISRSCGLDRTPCMAGGRFPQNNPEVVR
jgi:hypothetical protein